MLVAPLWQLKKTSHFTQPTAISSARFCTLYRIHRTAILRQCMEWAKNSETLILLAQSPAEHGILALRFDFRYVGDSSGKFADFTDGGAVEDLRAVYEFMHGHLPR